MIVDLSMVIRELSSDALREIDRQWGEKVTEVVP